MKSEVVMMEREEFSGLCSVVVVAAAAAAVSSLLSLHSQTKEISEVFINEIVRKFFGRS